MDGVRKTSITGAPILFFPAKKFVIFGMASNPEPKQPAIYIYSECAMAKPYSDDSVLADSLKTKRWMMGIDLE